MTTDTSRWWDGKLYTLLNDKLTGFRSPRGQLSISTLAKKMGVSTEALYRYMRSDRISASAAKKLIEATDNLVTREDLLPFLLA